ncbi:MAG: S16 family serine protease [Nitrospiraceae bacterium]
MFVSRVINKLLRPGGALSRGAIMSAIALTFIGSWLFPLNDTGASMQGRRELLISILGVTLEEKRPVGTVAHLVVSFEGRNDHGGLAVQFRATPGRFSHMAQTAVKRAIYRAAHAAGMDTDSWTVVLSVPHPGVTIYGESLSAMVSLSVIALAKGDMIPPDRVMTGTVGPDGRITPVGGVPLKVAAANQAHLRRVLVPEESDIADSDWRTPFLMQVSPVGSISQAYFALTDHPLSP